MLDGIKAFVKGVINRMFPAKNVEQALKIETCISSMMQTRIELWQRMYSGMAPWCKGYVKSLRTAHLRIASWWMMKQNARMTGQT